MGLSRPTTPKDKRRRARSEAWLTIVSTRLTKDEGELVDRAVSLSGMSRAQWMREVVCKAAKPIPDLQVWVTKHAERFHDLVVKECLGKTSPSEKKELDKLRVLRRAL